MNSPFVLLKRPLSGIGRYLLALGFVGLFAPTANAQAQMVRGLVYDARTLQPLAGATASLDGTDLGGLTDGQGRFQIQTNLGVGSQVTIRVRMIGYRTAVHQAQVGDEILRIGLEATAIELDEVIVMGTVGGTQRRALGHSVGQVRMDEIREMSPGRSLGQMLNARVPGAVVMSSGGNVGTGEVINIRGRSSFSLPGTPLVYVDGVRVSGDETARHFRDTYQVINRLDDINPNDIESIEVIRGPAAATLYGTEASSGVIQITTRQGSFGTPTQFSATIQQGANWMMNPEGRIPVNYWRDPATNQVTEANMVRLQSERGVPFFRTGHSQAYGVSLRGGTSDVRYYGSINVDKDQGATRDNHNERVSARGRISVAARENVDINASVGLVVSDMRYPTNNLANLIEGHPSTLNTPLLGHQQFPHEYGWEIDQYGQSVRRSMGSLQITHSPTSWLQHRVSVGLDLTREEDAELRPRLDDDAARFVSPVAARGSKRIDSRELTYFTVDYGATANWKPSERVALATSAGFQLFRNVRTQTQLIGREFPGPGLTTVRAAGFQTGWEDEIENITVGVFVQEAFSWQDRIFLTGAVRVDNNSAFGADFDLVAYPKASATWVVSEESFWNARFMNMLRLRAAFGASGRQPTAYSAIRTFAPVAGGDDVPGVVPGAVGNPDLRPERGVELEAGFEATLFGERLAVEFTAYDQRVKDAILLRNVPPSTGFYPAQQFANMGEIKNQGVELLVNWRALERRRHSLDVGLNLSRNSNEVISLGEGVDAMTVGWVPNQHRPGYPLASFFLKRVVSASAGPDGTPINVMCDGGSGPLGLEPGGPPVPCADAPQIYVGKPDPDLEGAVFSTLTLFDRWRIGALVDFKRGHSVYQWTGYVRCVSRRTCEENAYPDRASPTWHASLALGADFEGDHFVEDHSFAKLRELSLSHTLPDSWARSMGASRAEISIAGRNLHTWTGYRGIDPESTVIGHVHPDRNSPWESANVVPTLSRFVVRANVTF